jgi:hypothetical protein
MPEAWTLELDFRIAAWLWFISIHLEDPLPNALPRNLSPSVEK